MFLTDENFVKTNRNTIIIPIKQGPNKDHTLSWMVCLITVSPSFFFSSSHLYVEETEPSVL